MERLPPEIWLKVLQHADYSLALKLSETSHFFYSAVRSGWYTRKSAASCLRFLAEVETYRRNQSWAGNNSACSGCLRILLRHAFSRSMTSMRVGWQRGGANACKGVCIACALRAGVYRKAVRLNLGLACNMR